VSARYSCIVLKIMVAPGNSRCVIARLLAAWDDLLGSSCGSSSFRSPLLQNVPFSSRLQVTSSMLTVKSSFMYGPYRRSIGLWALALVHIRDIVALSQPRDLLVQ